VPSANLELLDMDLASLASIATAAKTFTAKENRLDILINNAGIMGVEPGKTTDGYEIQLGINHVGPALLTKLLLPTMLATAKQGHDVRIVTLSSHSHEKLPEGLCLDADKQDMSFTGDYSRYARSKLANVLFTRALATHYPEILSVSLHPGTIVTSLFMGWANRSALLPLLVKLLGKILFDTVEDGAKNTLWCATVDKAKIKNGAYYMPIGIEDAGSQLSRDEPTIQQLWEWTDKELKEKGYLGDSEVM
jgi:NAD(P)-dependent dehydrogenase (short-subunit alcohol dehydrogenase family)